MTKNLSPIFREAFTLDIPTFIDLKVRSFLTGKYKRAQSYDTARYHHDLNLKNRYFSPEDFYVIDLGEVVTEKGVTMA